VADALGALVRKELIRSDRPDIPGEDGYRFRHLLIRDAAYESIPKQLRADLHARHAGWLQERIGARSVEYDEIVGYHLEQAYGYRAELGRVDDDTRAVGRRAAELLGAAGRRAFLRSDGPAGANLLARAVAMLRPEDPLRVDLVPNVRVIQGLADLSWADRVLTEAVEASATTGDRALAAHALVQRGLLRLFNDPEVTPKELFDVSERAVGVFEELHDELGLARAWRLAAQAHYLDRHAERCAEASERALEHVRRTRDAFEEQEIIEWLAIALILGPTPAPAAISRCKELLAGTKEGSYLHAEMLSVTAPLLAMQRDATEADAAFERAQTIMADTGEWVWIALFWHSWVNVWRGTPELSEAELRAGYDALSAIGEKSHFSSLAHALANVVLAQGRYDEAERLVAECEAASRPNDVHAQIATRFIRAQILAHRGVFPEAEDLAREAIAFGESSDFLTARAEAFDAFADVLQLAGRSAETAEPLRSALELYEQKGNLLASDNVRARLAALGV
jgi:tetratricopeptide (TPR) repeat protein